MPMGENELSLQISDHGIEQVLWGTDCCHAMVLPENGAGAVVRGSWVVQEQIYCLPAV